MIEGLSLTYAVAGALGGFIACLIQEGGIEVPRYKDRKVYLGSLGGILISAVAGCIGDSNPTNAFVWGLGGVGVIKRLLERAPDLLTLKSKDP